MRKKTIILLTFGLSLFMTTYAQDRERKWNFGLLGGTSEYNGDLGNGFIDFNRNTFNRNWFGGVSLTRYLNSSFDFSLMGIHGYEGYYKTATPFKLESTLLSAYFKYKFANGYLLPRDSRIAPYLLAGAGYLQSSPVTIDAGIANYGTSGTDFPLIVGAGINFRVSKVVGISYQATLGYLSTDNRDNKVEGQFNDAFLYHTLGLNFNFGKQKDQDGDGVPDIKDKCADTPKDVKVDKTGCPIDTDKDGVADYLDSCPTVPGNMATKGCPDKDADGVADIEDECPTIAGLSAMKGCPDTDGDGIIDSKDQCPNQKGVLEMNGCPDRDGDKIIDKDDMCPDVAGLVKFKGCPDTDDDGIMDSEDLCPTLKGPLSTKGCPDTDNDGVTDNIDKCPTVPGLASNEGCPELKVEVKQLFQKALQGIEFETGKATIKPKSYPLLNSIAKVVIDNPTFKLIIEGHTDNVGNSVTNNTLSQNRAEAVAKYLIAKGADPLRVSGIGMGASKPVDTNKTPGGRARNRRVELKVEYLK